MSRALTLLTAILLVAGCTKSSRYSQALCVLVDVSGTYADQKEDVVEVIRKGILPGMLPGDSIMLIRIDSESYEETNVVSKLTLDVRPSHANAQKMAFSKSLDAFAGEVEEATYTDIRGAMMLAAEYLKETGAGTQTIVLFSDMQEDLPQGASRSLAVSEFERIRVVAVNVKKLRRDNLDPEIYRSRLTHWENQVIASGARDWRVIHDAEKLVAYLEERS